MKADTGRKLPIALGLLLIVLAIAVQMFLFIKEASCFDGRFAKIAAALSLAALAAAFVYVVTAFKKSSAKFFKLFMAAFVLAQLAAVLKAFANDDPIFAVACEILIFALLSVLSGTMDLGKKASIAMALGVLGLELFICISLVFRFFGISAASTGLVAFLVRVSYISLSAVLVIMMLLKYFDKELRDTN